MVKVPCKTSAVAVQNWECHLASAKTGLGSQRVAGNELRVVGVWGSGYWVLGAVLAGFWVLGFWVLRFWVLRFWVLGFWVLWFWVLTLGC